MRATLLLTLLAACDGKSDWYEPPAVPDEDGDGASRRVDCDDHDAMVYPGAEEVCDGVDDDCDGTIDDDASDASNWYADTDGDGFGDASVSQTACDEPAGYVADATDCDDAAAAVHPGADETDCTDPTDYNCDGSSGWADADGDGAAACEDCDDADATVIDPSTWYADHDGDGYSAGEEPETACLAPDGYTDVTGDCDDDAAAINPAGLEVCDDVDADEDCDGVTEDADTSLDPTTRSTFHADTDGDTFGDAEATSAACEAPVGSVSNPDDCDDTDAAVNPDADELCVAGDEDCDGLDGDDDPTVSDPATWYADDDGDTYGDLGSPTLACQMPLDFVDNPDDCDDGSADVNPGASEVCDALDEDEDCDGLADDADAPVSGRSSFYLDDDGDGYGAGSAVIACDTPAGYAPVGLDCDDTDPAVSPGDSEVCDAANTDEDCDGLADDDDSASGRTAWYRDLDGDGYGGSTTLTRCDQPAGYVADTADCDDASAAVNPGAAEVCDATNTDEDCDGVADDADASATGETAWYTDADADGFGTSASPVSRCDQPSGRVATADDCDDGDPAVNPDAEELYGDAVDDDCDGAIVPVGSPCTPNVGTTYASIDDALRAGVTACLPGGTWTEDPVEDGVIAGQGRWSTTLVGTLTAADVALADLTLEGSVVDPTQGSFTDVTLDAAGAASVVVTGQYDGLSLTFTRCELTGATDAALAVFADALGPADYAGTVRLRSSWFHDNGRALSISGQHAEAGYAVSLLFDSLNSTYEDDAYAGTETAGAGLVVDAADYNGLWLGSSFALGTWGATLVSVASSSCAVDTAYAPPRPASGSTCIDAGDTTTYAATDYWGLARDAAPDIGAVEY